MEGLSSKDDLIRGLQIVIVGSIVIQQQEGAVLL